MCDAEQQNKIFTFPGDLVKELERIATELGESPDNVAIAALEHFTRIPKEQRKASMRATSIRRRGV